MQKEPNSFPLTTADRFAAAGLRPPKTLTFAITGACNLSCAHCWVAAGAPASAAHVPAASIRRLVTEFSAFGGEKIRFTGGEPLCHPDCLELLRFAGRFGFAGISLQTNGLLIRDAEVAALSRLAFPGLELQISLDGATAPTHDLVRGEGAFEGVLDSLWRLARGGLASRVNLFFTEMRHNLEEIPAVLQLAEKLGVGSVAGGTLVLCGRAAAESKAAPPEPDQYTRLLQRFDTDPDFRQRYLGLGTIAALEWHRENSRSEGCTFVENPYLTARGLLYPCVLCHADRFAVAGVFDKHLGDVFAEGIPLWTSLLQISRRRAAEIRECADCNGRFTCSGGCMGRAWGSCGDLLAADDRCPVRKAVYRQKNSDSLAE